ncbi:MAG TPA: Uma2 family endonuclease [Phycisphaerae bacterium]|nr:Uma2 family endonuclease [Phycisphaerae bacterium]
MADTQTTKLTAAEFEEQFADVPNVELVRGEVIKLSPGGMGHSRPSTNASFLLETWARSSGLGRVVSNEAGLITAEDPDTVRGADVAYFSFARVPKGELPEGFSTVPPNLVVEVLGRGRGWRTLTTKVAEYLEMGVDLVWVVDPGKRTVHIFKFDAPPAQVSENERIEDGEILPGFSCMIAEFFED